MFFHSCVRRLSKNTKPEDRVSVKSVLHGSVFAKDTFLRLTTKKKSLFLKIAKTAGILPAALQQEKRRRK